MEEKYCGHSIESPAWEYGPLIRRCKFTDSFCVGSDTQNEPMGDYAVYDSTDAQNCPLHSSRGSLYKIFKEIRVKEKGE